MKQIDEIQFLNLIGVDARWNTQLIDAPHLDNRFMRIRILADFSTNRQRTSLVKYLFQCNRTWITKITDVGKVNWFFSDLVFVRDLRCSL